MRVQPHLPSSPFTAIVMSRVGFAAWACSAAKRPAPPAPRIKRSVFSSCTALPALDTERSEHLRAFCARRGVDVAIEATAVAVHADEQRAEAADAEFPERLGIEVVEVDVLDRLDPGRLERRRAADDGEIGAAEIVKRVQRGLTQAPLADDHPHAVLGHEGAGETLHPRARSRADADRGVPRRMLARGLDLLDVRCSVDRRVTAQIEAGRASAVEHVNLRRIADAVERAVQRHRVADAQRADLALRDRCSEVPMRHQNPYSIPAAVNVARARRAEWHCMFTATGFMVMCVAASSTCTANAVESPPRPCGPTPSWFTARVSSSSSFAPSESSQRVPRGRVAAVFARWTHTSAVPPTPTPTTVGGQVLPPASSTQSTTKVLIAPTPSAGTAIFSHELFSEPEPLGIISIARVSAAAEKST